MLRKLLKHEWKSVSKVLFPVNLAIILLTVIGCIILSTNLFDTKEALPLAVLLLVLYALSLMSFSFVTLIYVYVRFYKNLFTSEGYLMYTLPVTPTQLFHSKLIVGYFWTALNSLFTILSFAALGFAAGFHAAVKEADSVPSSFLNEMFSISINEEITETFSFADLFGYPPVEFFILLLTMILISCLSTVLMGYLSILLGQLMEKFKLAASIGFYIAIYLVTQIISSIAMILPNIHLMVGNLDSTSPTNAMAELYHNLLPSTIVTYLILGSIFYVISLLLMRRNVNLD